MTRTVVNQGKFGEKCTSQHFPRTTLLSLGIGCEFGRLCACKRMHDIIDQVPNILRGPSGSQSSRMKRRDESSEAWAPFTAEEPLCSDSHQTIFKRSSECWLLIWHKKCFVLLCPIGEQYLLSSPYLPGLWKLLFLWEGGGKQTDYTIGDSKIENEFTLTKPLMSIAKQS